MCAREDGTCIFSGTAQVRYGLNGTYAYKTATGSIGCNNQVFGDPLPYADKICEYLAAATPPTLPVANGDAYSVQSGQTLTVAAPGVLGNDSPGSGGGALTVVQSTQAAHGAVTVNANGSFTYASAAGYAGSDSFTYTIRNASNQESTATVSITVTSVTPPPSTWTMCAREDGTCIFSGTAQVRYGLNGTYAYKTATGSIGCNNQVFGDPLPYADKICEYMTTATPPTPPVANGDAYSVQSGQTLSVAAPGVLGNDSPGSGGGALTVVQSTQAAHGAVTVNANGSFTYASAAGYAGSDSFTYTIRNASNQESTATVSITVTNQGGQDIAKYLNFSETRIAKYKDNKEGAASYTFDDGLSSSFTIASIFEEHGVRASFFINPGFITDWPAWRALAERGHEIGNHSMTHPYLTDWSGLSDADLDYQINQAQSLIEQQIGIKPLAFVFPHNQASERTLGLVMTNHVASRDPGIFSSDPTYRGMNIVSQSVATNANWKLYDTLTMGGWFYIAGHGVDGDGWEPVTSQYLRDHLSYATSLSSRLWIDTFINVARYRLCRDQVAPESMMVNPKRASIRIGGSYNTSLCTQPLTVVIPILLLNEGISAQDAHGAGVAFAQKNGLLILNIKPGEEIYLQIP